MEAIYHPEGRITPNGAAFRYEYNIKDHLGNTRLTFADINNNGAVDITGVATTTEVLSENHYYPFGMNMGYDWMNNTAISPDTKYQYNGKEFNDDFGLNWNDYGARWYDGSLGRWMSVDKMAEDSKQIDKSPFQYGWNNPVINIDPDGNCPWCIGAIVGAATDYAFQVGSNLYSGKSVSESLTNIDGKSIAVAAALGAVGGGLADKAGKLFKGASKVDDIANVSDDLASRAKTIQNAQTNAVAKNKSTTAVADVVAKDGTKSRVVASSRNRLTPAQRKALKNGEIEVKGKGHAEKTIVDYAQKTGKEIKEVAASRPVCSSCEEALNKTGAKILTPLKNKN